MIQENEIFIFGFVNCFKTPHTTLIHVEDNFSESSNKIII